MKKMIFFKSVCQFLDLTRWNLESFQTTQLKARPWSNTVCKQGIYKCWLDIVRGGKAKGCECKHKSNQCQIAKKNPHNLKSWKMSKWWLWWWWWLWWLGWLWWLWLLWSLWSSWWLGWFWWWWWILLWSPVDIVISCQASKKLSQLVCQSFHSDQQCFFSDKLFVLNLTNRFNFCQHGWLKSTIAYGIGNRYLRKYPFVVLVQGYLYHINGN